MEIPENQLREATILIVDDSVVSLDRMETLLVEEGYENVITRGSPEGLENLVRDLHPSLIVLDYYMPERDGETVLEDLCETVPEPRLNVLFWTTAEEPELTSRVLRKGARDILRKEDTTREEILGRVENLLKAQLHRDQLRNRIDGLRSRVEERTEQLRETSLETIGKLARAAEFRDTETGDHIDRIGRLAAGLAERLGLEDGICEALRYAAPMHDVGKIGVPDDVLLKPDSLTDDEWEIMKQHTEFGAEILSGSDRTYVRMSEKIARYHHERWDGDGYPKGLREDRIPLEARITALCDVFDALLSERPYKEAWNLDKTLDLIREQRARQFDPDIVDCFLEHREEMVDLRNNHGEEATRYEYAFPEIYNSDLRVASAE